MCSVLYGQAQASSLCCDQKKNLNPPPSLPLLGIMKGGFAWVVVVSLLHKKKLCRKNTKKREKKDGKNEGGFSPSPPLVLHNRQMASVRFLGS